MYDLYDWNGKIDDISISYDEGLLDNGQKLLEYAEGQNISLPVISYKTTSNPKDVVSDEWEDSVSKADRADILIAVTCGAISGLIDSFFVGKVFLSAAESWGTDKTNAFVLRCAKYSGYKGDDLNGAIRFLEKSYHLAADSNAPEYGGGLQHHVRDFSHHFSIGGWFCSLYTQFTGKVIGTDTEGKLLITKVKSKKYIGKNLEEKILYGTIDWFFHMVSDMAGSSSTPGKGTGIPGPFLSLIKEISVMPFFKDAGNDEAGIRIVISKLFNGTLLAKRDADEKIIQKRRFDLRTEIGIYHEISKQSMPVIINECLVRGLYFIRRLAKEINVKNIRFTGDLKQVNPSHVLPFNNHTISRMITISSGIFCAVDAVDAGIRAIIENKGFHQETIIDFCLRINIVGIGRFVIACKDDTSFMAKDIEEARRKRRQTELDYEKAMVDLRCFTLSPVDARILYSIENLMLDDDISLTTNAKERAAKIRWQKEWKKLILSSLKIASNQEDWYFENEDDIDAYFIVKDVNVDQYLIVMEALTFNPYVSIHGDERDKIFKGLKFKSDYLKRVFVKKQDKILADDIKTLEEYYKKAHNRITHKKEKLAIGALGAGVATVATGGLALHFAPVIATAIAGESAAGLSGAALTSFSLAAIGGGSMAAGGLGVAGGTTVITGVGALLGLLGGSGASAIGLQVWSDSGYVVDECSKLLAFSKAILIDKFHDDKLIDQVYKRVKQQIKTVDYYMDTYLDADEDKKIRTNITRNLKYMNHCASILEDLAQMKS